MTEHPKTSTARSLPAGWCWATLDQLFSSITDGDHSAPPQVEEGIPLLVIGDVRGGIIDFSDTRYVARDYYAAIGESRKPRKGDLLYTVTGSFGIPVVVESDREFCVQRHIAILKPVTEASVRYLAFALATTEAYYQAVDAATGTAQKTVGLQRLRQFQVPLATVREQRRIVEALESYFTRLDDAEATLERVERNLKRYRASVLKAAVEGQLVPTEAALAKQEGRSYEPASVLLERILAERRRRWSESGKKGKYEETPPPDTANLSDLPQGWCWATIPQLGELNRGKSKHRPRNDPRLLGGSYPFIQTAEVRHSECFIETHESTYSEFGLAQSRLWPAGTLCITIAANIAETGILKFSACFPDSIVGFLQENATLTRYVELFLRTARERLSQYAPATAQKNINLQVLSEVAVPLPPAAEQERIVRKIDQHMSVARHVEAVVAAEIARSKKLRQSLLKWAFEGKLADQDPKEEPASVLLERIKAERRRSKAVTDAAPPRAAKKKQVRA